MKDFSLDFFSRDVRLSQKEELFIHKYKSRPLNNDNKSDINRNLKFEALGLLTYLQMLLFSDGETGFYYDVSDNRFSLLANKLGMTNKQLSQMLDWCFELNILDKALYQKYKILTSLKMQDDYSKVLNPSRPRAQNIKMEYVYQDRDFTQKYENALQKFKNTLKKDKNAQQKTGEESRPDDVNNINREIEDSTSFSLENFKNQFPDKKCSITTVPKNIDLELLTQKVNNSDFLKTRKNLSIDWLIEHYKEIISGDYDDYERKKKQTQNYTNREYSEKELNSLYTDLDNVEL